MWSGCSHWETSPLLLIEIWRVCKLLLTFQIAFSFSKKKSWHFFHLERKGTPIKQTKGKGFLTTQRKDAFFLCALSAQGKVTNKFLHFPRQDRQSTAPARHHIKGMSHEVSMRHCSMSQARLSLPLPQLALAHQVLSRNNLFPWVSMASIKTFPFRKKKKDSSK